MVGENAVKDALASGSSKEYWNYLYDYFVDQCVRIKLISSALDGKKLFSSNDLIDYVGTKVNFKDIKLNKLTVKNIELLSFTDYFNKTIINSERVEHEGSVNSIDDVCINYEFIKPGLNIRKYLEQYKLSQKYKTSISVGIKFISDMIGVSGISDVAKVFVAHKYERNDLFNRYREIKNNSKNKGLYRLLEHLCEANIFLDAYSIKLKKKLKNEKINVYDFKKKAKSIISQFITFTKRVKRTRSDDVLIKHRENKSSELIEKLINAILIKDKKLFENSICRKLYRVDDSLFTLENYDYEAMHRYIYEFSNSLIKGLRDNDYNSLVEWIIKQKKQSHMYVDSLKKGNKEPLMKLFVEKLDAIKKNDSLPVYNKPPSVIMVPGSGDFFVFDEYSKLFISPQYYNTKQDFENSFYQAIANYRIKADSDDMGVADIYGKLFNEYYNLPINKNVRESKLKDLFNEDYVRYVKGLSMKRSDVEDNDRKLTQLRRYFQENF